MNHHNRKQRKKLFLHKAAAFFLIAAMLLESSGLKVFASEIAANESGFLITEDDSGNSDDNSIDIGNSDADNDDNSENSDNENTNDNSDNGSNEETDDGVDSGSDEVSDVDNDNGNDEETDEGIGSDNEDNANEYPEETDEDTSSKDKIDIAAAENAFAKLASEKNLMALIYLTDAYSVRSKADENSPVASTLGSGHTVYLRGVTITENQIWYRVQFWDSETEMEGYVQQQYLAYADEDWRAWEAEYLANLADSSAINPNTAYSISAYAASYTDVEQFPASYRSDLTKLKTAHPNWIFVPLNTNLDFNTAVSSEMGAKSLIYPNSDNKSKGWVGDPCPTESGWNYATKDAVSYHMDPRNFLTETYVFQFEQLTFNSSYHTVDAIQNFLNSTFMKGTLSDDGQKMTYAQAFYEIGSSRKLSPITLLPVSTRNRGRVRPA